MVGSSKRWRSADLTLPEVENADILLETAYSPVLENLAVTGYPSQMVRLRLLGTPSLRSVTFVSSLKTFVVRGNILPVHVEQLLNHLRMPQLRHFQMSHNLFSGSTDFLADLGVHSPLIEDFTANLKGLTFASLAKNLHLLVHLKNLTVFDKWNDVRGAHAADADALLALLTPDPGSPPVCPQLTKLRIREYSLSGDDKWVQDFLRFAERRLDSSPHFRRLHVRYTQFTPAIPKALLRPFLERRLHITATSPPVDHPSETPWTGLKI